ncbi:MAG: hypothetical protein ACKOW3_00660 [Hyphomicrobium sp.]
MISTSPGKLKRAVFSFNHESYNPTAMNIAADLAKRLQLDLLGLFVMDHMLDLAVSYPEAREFSAPFRDWRLLDAKLLRQQQDLIAKKIEKQLEIKAKEEKLRTTFEIASGSFEEVLKGFASQSDILIFSEPKDPLGQITKSFRKSVDIAMQLLSSALIIPRSASQKRGPILVFVTDKDDPSLDVASLIAQTTEDKIIVVPLHKEDVISEEVLLAEIQKSDPHLVLHKMSLVVSSRYSSNIKNNELIAEICRLINVPLLIHGIEDAQRKPLA